MEKKKFSRKQIEPQMIKICGEEYPAICSMAAIDEMEDALGKPFGNIVNELSGGSFTVKQICIVAGACLRAGGTDVMDADLLASIDLGNYLELITQITMVIAKGLPDAEPKNVSKK